MSHSSPGTMVSSRVSAWISGYFVLMCSMSYPCALICWEISLNFPSLLVTKAILCVCNAPSSRSP